ncbi:MAG: hypothetical protein ACPGGK_08190 [Pikeienuella sp.]
MIAQIAAAEALLGSDTLKAAADADARRRIFSKVATKLDKESGAPFRVLSLKDISDLKKFKGFRNFTHYTGETGRFVLAGIGDEGTTAEYRLAGCIQTTNLRQIEERLRISAEEVLDLNADMRDIRRKVAAGGE